MATYKAIAVRHDVTVTDESRYGKCDKLTSHRDGQVWQSHVKLHHIVDDFSILSFDNRR